MEAPEFHLLGRGYGYTEANFRTFFWTIFGPILDLFWGYFIGGGRPLVLRERWDTVYQYSGRGERQTVVTEGGVEDELLLRKEG